MCGIAGLVSAIPLSHAQQQAVASLSCSLAHRGPDGSGEFAADPHVRLAVRRLAIVDVAGGNQPLSNEDGSIVLIVNGMIYNYVELAALLEKRGHRFRTGNDCETLLHLYEDEGLDFLANVRGMFAFALWDSRRRRLILGRDRMGQKPLYIYQSDRSLLFASELRAMLGAGLVPFTLDSSAIDLYFRYQFVPEPLTPVRGVQKLPPATLLTIDVDGWRLEERRYWQMHDALAEGANPAQLIREELDHIGQLMVRADVPIGISLSGGLDSAAVAAITSRYTDKLACFSVGYAGEPPYDERRQAAALAGALGLPSFATEVRNADVVDFFPTLTAITDDPVADIAAYGYYRVAALAHDHGVKVLLQGQGGDELFWYEEMQHAVRQNRRKHSAAMETRRRLWPYLGVTRPPARPRAFARWLLDGGGLATGRREYLRDIAMNADQVVFYEIYADYRQARAAAGSMFTPALLERADELAEAAVLPTLDADPAIAITQLICSTYLLCNGLVQGDRLSMASSVEARSPLIDERLVELVVGLRKQESDENLPPKAWLKAALANSLPKAVLERPKQGFQPPAQAWHKGIFARYGHTLNDGVLVSSGVLLPDAARRFALGPHPRGVTTPLSFKALVLETWLRGFNNAHWSLA